MRSYTSRTLVVTLLSVGLMLAACGSSSEGLKKSAQEQIDAIHDELVAAEAFDLALTTDKLPSDTSGLLTAIGKGNRSPAFDGQAKLVNGGATIEADLIAVDGEVWAKTGFSPAFMKIDPTSLKAPNPATLVGTGEDGLATLFSSATALKKTGETREGSLVLHKIVGTVPGTVMATLIPTASEENDFDVTFRVTDKGHLHDLTMTGPFYATSTTTYRLTIEALDTTVEISAPTN